MTQSSSRTDEPRPWYHPTLSKQIVVGLVLGVIAGYIANVTLAPHPAEMKSFLAWTGLVYQVFLHLIRAMIAPLVFASLVQGIAGHEDMKRVGLMGVKTLVYFEVVTCFALAIGLLCVNLLQPGAGVVLKGDVAGLTEYKHEPQTIVETLLHIFPTSVIHAMAEGDVLQIVCFSVVFAFAVSAAGEAGRPVLLWCESLRQVMFKFAGLIMALAPFGVAAAVAVTVAQQGLESLLGLGKLLLTLYLALVVFIVVIFGSIIALAKIPLRPFVRAVWEPFTLAFATANSEAALPDAFAKMERLGVPRGIVGFVLPLGYSFNLDGSTLYLAMASVFIAQAAESAGTIPHFGLLEQLGMMLTLMLTSKGVAAVPRVSIVVLIATLQQFKLPLEGAAMILGIDAFMDMARTSVNVLGNCLASAVIARWEGEFDDKQAQAEFGEPHRKTSQE